MTFVSVPGNQPPERAEELYFEGPGGVEGKGGVRLRAVFAPSTHPEALGTRTRGTVIVCPGRTEFIEKYFEVIGELQGRGFAVLCVDWRGQGLSGRETGNPQKGHMGSFDDAVTDLFTALRLFKDRLPAPHIILAHSMGGAIALRALQSNRIKADAALFSAPMWGIKGLTDLSVQVARFMESIGLGQNFILGAQTKWKREAFRRNTVTRHEERFNRAQGLVRADPRLALAGPTWGWVAAAVAVIEQLRVPGSLAHLRCPVTIMSAGAEALVDNASHIEIARALPNARHVTVPGAKHELLMETDDVRRLVWAEFDALMVRMGPAGAVAEGGLSGQSAPGTGPAAATPQA